MGGDASRHDHLLLVDIKHKRAQTNSEMSKRGGGGASRQGQLSLEDIKQYKA